MKLKDFFTALLKSLNPFKYNDLILFRKRDATAYFFQLLFFAIIFAGILSIPKLGYLPSEIDKSLSKFTKFTITGIQIETSEPIVLLESPEIVLDFRKEPEPKDAFILITQTDVYLKKFKPNVFEMRLYNTTKVPVSNYSDVLSDVTILKEKIWILFFFMLPSIFFFVFILNVAKFLIILGLFLVLDLVISLIRKKNFDFPTSYKITIFSLTVIALMDITLSPFVDFGMIPYVLFIIILAIAHKTSRRIEKRKKDDNKENKEDTKKSNKKKELDEDDFIVLDK